MAARSENTGTYWGHNSRPNDEITYSNHLSSLKTNQIAPHILSVITCTGSGAASGAILGAPVAGIGAVPGALIGGGSAFIGSFSAIAGYEYYSFYEYRKSLSKEVALTLEEVIKSKVGGLEECSIRFSVATIPVKIRGEKQVYEKEALEGWLIQKGTSPFTRRPFTAADIIIDYEAVARIGKACNELLNNSKERAKLSQTCIDGIIILRGQTLEQVEKYYNEKVDELEQARKNRKISPRQFAAEVAKLAEIADPVLREEGKSEED